MLTFSIKTNEGLHELSNNLGSKYTLCFVILFWMF